MVKSAYLGLAAGLALLGSLAAGSVEAMPIAPRASLAAEAPVMVVRDGCGPGYFRTPYGRCRPAGGFGERGYDRPRFFGGFGYDGPRYGGRGYDRPRYGGRGYDGRRCVIRNTYDGPRRVCRY